MSSTQVTPMRTPDRETGATQTLAGLSASSASQSSSDSLPPLAVIALNRMAFGPQPGDLEYFQSLGSDDNTRLTKYVDEQLDPESIDDSDLDFVWQPLSGFETLSKDSIQLWLDHVQGDHGRYRPIEEMERAVFMRALYSRRQLNEVLADFWHNHFNIYGRDYYAAPLWVHYDRDIIRANMLGNFRAMIEAVAKSTPMLYYLDNYTNTRSGPNENFARELFELHTLGAENYMGVKRQHEVPLDENGIPIAFVDDDVYEATRCLTGWSFDSSLGEFEYEPDKHDRFQKRVLGSFLAPDQPPLKDGHDVLDLVAFHPGTARYVCRKLCRRFIGDDPPQRIVNEAAAVFMANHHAPDQLKQVVRTILLSSEFRSTWGQKIKRPFELIVSSLRSVNASWLVSYDDSLTNKFMYYFENTGHRPFRWRPPDGYPDTKEHWTGSNALVMSWRTINWLADVKNSWDGRYQIFDPIRDTPSHMRTAMTMADFWILRVLGRPMAEVDRLRIIDFMAGGRNPNMILPIETDEASRERLWGMIALIMMSPDNHMR